ncbi:hypothetical protein EDB85DRAFT_2144956 [Lactarius pseudohatsudake]|nr:hypothetical protein EDB85DRAFT_2144956 [Lactarius pseudohatsudake]
MAGLLKKRLISIPENKSKFTLVDPSGTPYARLTTAMFNLTGKIAGQRYSRGVSSLPRQDLSHKIVHPTG